MLDEQENVSEQQEMLEKPEKPSRAPSGRARKVGGILKEKRGEKRLSVDTVVSDLRIQKEYIVAIEANKYEDLPVLAYACGFVRSYANYLGFDGEEIVTKFKREAESLSAPAEEMALPPALKAEDAEPTAKIIGLSLLALAVIYSLWSFFSSPDDIRMDEDLAIAQQEELPDLDDVDATSGGNLGVSVGMNAEKTLSNVEKGLAIPVVIFAENDSWIEVSDYKSNVLLSRILKEGESYTLPNQTGLKLATGNAGEIDIKVAGKSIQKLGGVGVVKRNISVDQLIKDNH